MVSLTQDLHRVKTASDTVRVKQTRILYQDAVMWLLQHDAFYGRVLSQLTLTITDDRAPLQLRPVADEWQLAVNPAALQATTWTGDNWLAMLRHTVLHLLWDHPQRYATALKTPKQAALVRWATDAAINDYLTDLPEEALTSRQIATVLKQRVSPWQDSAVYWRLLQKWQATPEQQARRLSQAGPMTNTGQLPVDGHATWQLADPETAANREQWRSQLFTTVVAAMSDKQRGTLPGAIQAALTPLVATRPLDWRALIQRGLGQVPAGRQAAYGRFNRRQPARMELPGSIVQTWQKIAVFVDESGSMGNNEVRYLLGQLAALLTVYPTQVTVYPFDTQVHEDQRFQLERHPQDLRRTGGGGTRFQAVFDALPRVLAGQAGSLVIILTDGYGERRVQPTLPATIVWLLTSPITAFSVKEAPGSCISLANDPQWQALRRLS